MTGNDGHPSQYWQLSYPTITSNDAPDDPAAAANPNGNGSRRERLVSGVTELIPAAEGRV